MKNIITAIFSIYCFANFGFTQNNHYLHFDGINDYVSCGVDSTLNLVDSFTIESLINPSNWCNGELGYIISRGGLILEVIGPTTDYYNLNNNSLVFWAVVDGIWYYYNTPSNSIVLNNWQHVAVSYENGEVIIYVNGVVQELIQNGELSGQIDDNLYSTFFIGGNSQWQSFNGGIDEIRYWNTVRTHGEIINNMNENIGEEEIEDLVGYWSFNEGNGTTVFDLSGNNNDGEINGATWDDPDPDYYPDAVDLIAPICANGTGDFLLFNSIAGNRIAVIMSFADWDNVASGASSFLEAKYQQYESEGLIVIGVIDNESSCETWASDNEVTFPIIPGYGTSYEIGGSSPDLYIINHEFKLVYYQESYNTASLETAIELALCLLPETKPLIITEIMQNPSAVADDSGEWFEIYNIGEAPIDLLNWSITDAGSDNHTISSSLMINPGEYKVLGINSNTGTNGGVNIDYQYDGSPNDITLSNGADEIILVDPYGVVCDSVAYDGGTTFPDPTGASMALVHPDSNNNIGSNWEEATTAYGSGDLGTPGLPNFSSDIDVNLATIDFDTVYVGQSSDMTLSISNIGNTLLDLDSVYTMTDVFSVPFTQTSIDNSLDLVITFTPSIYGTVEDILVLMTNDPDESHLEIPLIGFGYVPSANIVLESSSIDFGTVMDGLSENNKLAYYNTGDMSLEIDTVYIAGSNTFSIIGNDNSVAVNDTGFVEIKFSPDDEASFEGILSIVSNDPDTDTVMVSLTGIGGQQAPIMELSDDSLYFGVVVADQTVTRQTTIYNTGMLDLEVEELNMAGSELFTTTFSDATVEPGDSVDIVFQFALTEQVPEATATATIIASGVANQTITLEAGYFGPVWHVATTGSDETGDGSVDNPFATIQTAIDSSSNGESVLVAAGTYVENINYNGKNVAVIGENRESTIIDGNQVESVVTFHNGEDSTAVISGFTLLNGNAVAVQYLPFPFPMRSYGGGININSSSPTISDIKIIGNTAYFGGGISINNYSNPKISDVIIIGNESDKSAGIAILDYSNAIVNNVLIANNSSQAMNGHGVIYCEFHSSLTVNNSTITENNIFGNAGNIVLADNSTANINNSILWNNSSEQFTIAEDGELFDPIGSPFINVTYSNIQGGWEGEGNIDANPLFCAPDSGDYSLAENSPCLGTGENGANMGPFGVGCSILVDWNFSLSEPVIEVMGADNEWNPGDTISIAMDFCNNTDVAHNYYPGVTIESDSSLTSLHSGHIWFYAMFADTCHAISWGAIANTSIISDTVVTFSAYPEALNCQNQTEYCIDGDTLTFEVPIVVQVASAEPEYFIPEVFALHQNYPNPFNPVTSLRYDLPEDGLVNITIYDMMGRIVKTLVNSSQTAGYKSIQWNATNNRNEAVSAGLYLYTIQAGEFRQTKKMVLLK